MIWRMSSSQQQTATLSSPAASASSAVLVTATNSRRGVIIFNEGSTALYLAFAATATTSAYTTQVAANGVFTLDPVSNYGGPISGIWAGSPTGNARVTVW
jgi:hypothetical protein